MTTRREQMIDKVRKLLAKARDSGCTEEEAALYAAHAQDLLVRYNLSMADVAEEERDEKIVRVVFDPKYADPWRWAIVRECARLYMCKAMYTDVPYTYKSRKFRGRTVQGWRRGFVLYGRPHACEVAKSMCEYLFSTVLRLASEYVDNPDNLEWDTPRAARLGFERGCGERLSDRLYRLYADEALRKKPEVNQSGNPQNLPALYKSEHEFVRDWVEQNVSTTKVRSGYSKLNSDHADAGARAADDVSLSTQVGGGRSSNLLPRS